MAHNGEKLALVHREVYSWHHGLIPKGHVVDHTCFNRRCCNPEHLRLVSHKQNMENRSGMAANNKSGYRGVYRKKNRWCVTVGHNGKKIYGGYYSTLEEANEAAIALRLRLFTHNEIDRAA